MKLFVSYPSEYRRTVESVVLTLRNGGHTVFFDRDDLPPGQAYDEQIETAIQASSGLIFFMAPESFAQGRYQLSELEVARKRWPSAHRQVLPVLLAPTELAEIPEYLKSVTILQPSGNMAADVLRAVRGLKRRNWKSVAMWGVGIILAASLIVALLRLSRTPVQPTELTEQTADSLVAELIPEADKVLARKIVQIGQARPFLFLVYESSRDIFFTAVKWRDNQWRVVRTLREEIGNFLVSDGQISVDEASRSIVFQGCRPKMCTDAWGYLYYQFDLDRGWLLKADASAAGAEIIAPFGYPDTPADLYHFERRFYGSVVPEVLATPSVDAAILKFPRKREVPPMWDRSDETAGRLDTVQARFLDALKNPYGTAIERVYREDFDGDGRVEWLVQASRQEKVGEPIHKYLQVLADSKLGSVFEDPGDIDAAWSRLSLYPLPAEPPYVAIGGHAGSGGFPFWYALQANDRGALSRQALSETIENMLNEAFPALH